MRKDKEEPQIFIDGISELSGGMNSGVVPQLLAPNQTALSINATHRGGYITNRPVVKKLTLDFGGSVALETLSTRALFQGACFYQPDYGPCKLVAQIGGRLFTFTPDQVGGATLEDITISGDANPSIATQAWLWQAERWVIITDGQSLPVFYDGSTSRRSYGPTVLLATVDAPGFTAPAIGSSVQVNVTLPYSGPFNIPVLVIEGGAISTYTIQPPAPGPAIANARLKVIHISGSVVTNPAVVIPIGSQVFAIPSRIGVIFGGGVPPASNLAALGLTNPPNNQQIEFFATTNNTADVPLTAWNINSKTLTVNGVMDLFPNATYDFYLTAIGQASSSLVAADLFDIVITYNNPNPNTLIGTIQTAFTTPNRLTTIDVVLDTAYTGADDQPVWIGNYLFLISKIPPPAAQPAVTLINQTDTAGTVHAATATKIFSIAELPAGRMGTYGLGRIWMSLVDGRSFVAGDIVGGSAGSITYQNRDAILKFTENTFLAGGGAFVVPGSVGDIRFMRFSATLDVSLGQGPLQVGTPKAVFSCQAPVDRLIWQDITNPILTQSLISNGGLAQNSTINANGDILMRAIDGIRSLILARRDFDTWGNVPQSRELDPLIALDDTSLLQYSSAIIFDNRLLMTAFPNAGPFGTFHNGLFVLNFDPISSLRGKGASIYDGLWTGLNVLQLVEGIMNGLQRAFAFCYNIQTAAIELYEIFPSATTGALDNDTIPITWAFESAALFRSVKGKGEFTYCELIDGELYISDLIGLANFQVFYRPDYDQCWHRWHSFSICAQNPDGTPKQYRTRLGLGSPDVRDCDAVTNKPFRFGRTFQVRVQITGNVKIRGALFKAVEQPEPFFAPLVCDELCQT